ncbi:MAG TPA: NAD-dependent epimerase/dehydratase family protein [Halioglobus sp.]
MKCLVSGATGFIGRELCQHLAAHGNTVIALSKNGAPLDSGVSTVALDLTVSDPDSELLRGVEVFFHLAGIAHRQAQQSDYEQLNCAATVRLARLAATAGVRCFIFLSSVKAMGSPPSAEVRTESACTRPRDFYGLSKWQAERALREQFANNRMSVVIVRPALVYGANVKGNLKLLASAVRRGLPRPPEVGTRSMIALEDLVKLLCAIAQRPPSGVHTWIACGVDSYSTRDIYDLLRQACGKGRGIGWLPHWVWRLCAHLMDLATGRADESTYDKLFSTEVYSNAAVLAETNWRPQVRLEDVIKQVGTADL